MTPSISDVADRLPLTPLEFEVLLALSDADLHGYAIMRTVEDRSGGLVSVHAGTLYRALARLVDSGLLEERDDAPDRAGEPNDRRRVYRLTRLGRAVARAEAERLESQVGSARAFGLLGGTG